MKFKNHKEVAPKFLEYANSIKSNRLRATSLALLDFPDFWTHVASLGFHHAYDTGLIVHTLEVTHNALHIAKLFPDGVVNRDCLVTASLWHDLAKIWDYKTDGSYENFEKKWWKDPYHNLIHHIAGSCAEFTAAARANKVPDEEVKLIQHCILSHHGCKEYGAVKNPQAIEAIILSQADMLSAHKPWNEHRPL